MNRVTLAIELGEQYRDLSPFEKHVLCSTYKKKFLPLIDKDYMKFLRVFKEDDLTELKNHLRERKLEPEVRIDVEDVQKYIGK